MYFSEDGPNLLALCEDNSVWSFEADPNAVKGQKSSFKWIRIPDIPQD
jgi:hypothetical protein